MLEGHYRYYGEPTNYRALDQFRRNVAWSWQPAATAELVLNLPNFLDRKFGGGLSVNARGRKICVRGRLVWAGSNDHESSRVGS